MSTSILTSLAVFASGIDVTTTADAGFWEPTTLFRSCTLFLPNAGDNFDRVVL